MIVPITNNYLKYSIKMSTNYLEWKTCVRLNSSMLLIQRLVFSVLYTYVLLVGAWSIYDSEQSLVYKLLFDNSCLVAISFHVPIT